MDSKSPAAVVDTEGADSWRWQVLPKGNLGEGGQYPPSASSTSVDLRGVKTVALKNERQFLRGRKLIILKNTHVGDSQPPVTVDQSTLASIGTPHVADTDTHTQ